MRRVRPEHCVPAPWAKRFTRAGGQSAPLNNSILLHCQQSVPKPRAVKGEHLLSYRPWKLSRQHPSKTYQELGSRSQHSDMLWLEPAIEVSLTSYISHLVKSTNCASLGVALECVRASDVPRHVQLWCSAGFVLSPAPFKIITVRESYNFLPLQCRPIGSSVSAVMIRPRHAAENCVSSRVQDGPGQPAPRSVVSLSSPCGCRKSAANRLHQPYYKRQLWRPSRALTKHRLEAEHPILQQET